MPNTPDESPLHILLVEDNADDVAIAKHIFARSGIAAQLHVANDGREAIDLLNTSRYWRDVRPNAPRPDLALLDLSMPRMDGLAVLRHMKTDPQFREVPVVVLTGETDEHPLRECMELGTNMYLLKPMAISDVVNIVIDVQRHLTTLSTAKARRRGRPPRSTGPKEAL